VLDIKIARRHAHLVMCNVGLPVQSRRTLPRI